MPGLYGETRQTYEELQRQSAEEILTLAELIGTHGISNAFELQNAKRLLGQSQRARADIEALYPEPIRESAEQLVIDALSGLEEIIRASIFSYERRASS